MKKIYIVDLIFLLINISSLFIYSIFINKVTIEAAFIYSLFLVLQIFLNLRFKAVMKYQPRFRPSWKEDLYIAALLLGKIQFMLVLFNDTSWLYWSVLQIGFLSVFILDYSYISDEKVICNLKKSIEIINIEHIEARDNLFSTIYIRAQLNNQEEIKFKLSREEYQYLQELR